MSKVAKIFSAAPSKPIVQPKPKAKLKAPVPKSEHEHKGPGSGDNKKINIVGASGRSKLVSGRTGASTRSGVSIPT